MREIITISMGSCGNKMGETFWEFITPEHNINNSGLYESTEPMQINKVSSFFNQSSNEKYLFPRALWIDLEPSTINSIQGGKIGKLVNPDLIVTGNTSAGNNWGKGHYTEGAELVDQVLEKYRHQAEYCDNLVGFQMMHSLGGGTGSGLGTLTMSKLREEFPDRVHSTFSVLPSEKVSDIVVEPYNVVLSMHQFVENADLSVIFDNESLQQICFRTLKLTSPNYDDLNYIATTAMSNITCGFRLPGQLNADWRKMASNLVPFPRLHFLMTSFAPFTSKSYQAFGETSVASLVQEIFDKKNMMCAVDPLRGKYLTGSAIFRGQLSSGQIEEEMANVRNQMSSQFVQWIPDNIKISLCNVPMLGIKASSTFLGNSTAIMASWKRIQQQFTQLFRRKAFLYYYTGEGMDEMEFTEAESNLNDLISEYEQYENARTEEEVEKEEDEQGEQEQEQEQEESEQLNDLEQIDY